MRLFRSAPALTFTAMTLVALFASADEAKQEQYWYRVEVQTGDTTYQCLGSTQYDEKELARRLDAEENIQLNDAAYIDANGKIKSWQDWDPKASSRLYLNGRYVILVNPLKGDPRKTGARK